MRHGFHLIDSGVIVLSSGEIFGGEVEDDDVAPWDPPGSEGEERGTRAYSGNDRWAAARYGAGPDWVPAAFFYIFFVLSFSFLFLFL
jgi:hypothetical protein